MTEHDLEAAIEHLSQARTHLFNLRNSMPETEDAREKVIEVIEDLVSRQGFRL